MFFFFFFFFLLFFLIDLFFRFKIFGCRFFLSLTSETHAHRFLLKDDKHPSKIVPYAFSRSAHQNGYSCWPLE